MDVNKFSFTIGLKKERILYQFPGFSFLIWSLERGACVGVQDV